MPVYVLLLPSDIVFVNVTSIRSGSALVIFGGFGRVVAYGIPVPADHITGSPGVPIWCTKRLTAYAWLFQVQEHLFFSSTCPFSPLLLSSPFSFVSLSGCVVWVTRLIITVFLIHC